MIIAIIKPASGSVNKSRTNIKEVIEPDLDKYLRETKFDFEKLPKKFHKYYTKKLFQCWQLTDCSEDIRNKCPAYLNHEYRFWKVTECKLEKDKQSIIKEKLSEVIKLEDNNY